MQTKTGKTYHLILQHKRSFYKIIVDNFLFMEHIAEMKMSGKKKEKHKVMEMDF